VDPHAGRVILARREPPSGLEIALRVAITAAMPRHGVLPLHAAGIARGEEGLVFFGESGAGKTTIAAASPGGVFSDELVAVDVEDRLLFATGFWGAGAASAPPEPARLEALIALDRGPAYRLLRLDPIAARRRLVRVILVPPLADAWGWAIAALGRLSPVPAFRLEWRPPDLPWDALFAASRSSAAKSGVSS
jgi:hypothetical protein